MRTIMLRINIPNLLESGGGNLDILYATSARLGKLSDPPAGALFAIEVGGKGLTLPFFEG
jgi:sugar lactone lactonase YvrE